MSYEIPLFKPAGFTAASSLAAKQFYGVKLNSTAGQLALCDTDGEFVFAVLQNDPAAGEAAEPMCAGITKIVAGETLTPNMFWGIDVNGKAKQVEETATGADLADWAMGKVIVGAAAGELAVVTIGLMAYQVTA